MTSSGEKESCGKVSWSASTEQDEARWWPVASTSRLKSGLAPLTNAAE